MFVLRIAGLSLVAFPAVLPEREVEGPRQSRAKSLSSAQNDVVVVAVRSPRPIPTNDGQRSTRTKIACACGEDWQQCKCATPEGLASQRRGATSNKLTSLPTIL